MRVAMVTAFGPPEVLELCAVADPEPGPGQVVVDVAAADVLWLETALRAGGGREHFTLDPPYVPGGAVAGTVGAVGPGVDPGLSGTRVAVHTGLTGGYAERVVVDAAEVVPVPEAVEPNVAAAVLHDGVTAIGLCEGTGIGAGDRVLVVGASGGLGIASMQLAAARGARVVATARDRRKIDRLRDLGGATIVDSEGADWVQEARTALGGAADVVLDNIGGRLGQAAFELVGRGGRFSAHGTPSGEFTAVDPAEAARRGVTLRGIADVQFTPDELRRLTAAALAEAAAGHLRPVIGQTYPLDAAADAHRAIEQRTVFGKTLLVP